MNQSSSNHAVRGVILGLIPTCLWGSFYVVGRLLYGEDADSFDPLYLTFLRYLFASFFLLIFLSLTKRTGLLLTALKQDWKWFFWLGATGIVGEGLLQLGALQYTTALRCSMLANASPIFTVILAYFFLKEGFSWRKGLGMVIGFAGVTAAVLLKGGDAYSGAGQASMLPGDLMALASGIAWAAYTVGGTRVEKKYDGTIGATCAIFFGTIQLACLLPFASGKMTLDLGCRLWIGVFYMGVFTGGIAYACWYAALKYLKAGTLGAFGYLSLAVTLLLSLTVLRESFRWCYIPALGAILFGVWLMMSPGRKRS